MQWDEDRVRDVAARAGVAAAVDASAPAGRIIDGTAGPLHLLDWGGDGPPALLLHGGALTARTWDFVCLALRGGWRLVALDLRGHGDSTWADSYRLDDYVEDVVTVLDGLGLEAYHLVGMSMGGVVAAITANAHPERFRSLTLVDIAPGVEPGGTKVMRGFVESVGEMESIDAVVESALRVSPGKDRERVAYRMEALLKQTPEGRWRWKRDSRSAPDYLALFERIGQLDRLCIETGLPVLLVRGERSRLLDEASAEGFVARVPGARLAVAPGAGHNVQEDNPAFLADALGRFWA